jgi:peptidoglycan hydrolase CwlO-like protein
MEITAQAKQYLMIAGAVIVGGLVATMAANKLIRGHRGWDIIKPWKVFSKASSSGADTEKTPSPAEKKAQAQEDLKAAEAEEETAKKAIEEAAKKLADAEKALKDAQAKVDANVDANVKVGIEFKALEANVNAANAELARREAALKIAEVNIHAAQNKLEERNRAAAVPGAAAGVVALGYGAAKAAIDPLAPAAVVAAQANLDALNGIAGIGAAIPAADALLARQLEVVQWYNSIQAAGNLGHAKADAQQQVNDQKAATDKLIADCSKVGTNGFKLAADVKAAEREVRVAEKALKAAQEKSKADTDAAILAQKAARDKAQAARNALTRS